MKRSQRYLRIAALLMILLAAGAWIYRFQKNQADESQGWTKVKLDLRFTAPIGYEFCAGKSAQGDDVKPNRLAHANLDLKMGLPPHISIDPKDQSFGAKEIVFHPGKTDVDVYKHLDSGRLIHTQGVIRLEGNGPMLNVRLDMAEWPSGRYVIGIRGDPFFGYCTIDFLD